MGSSDPSAPQNPEQTQINLVNQTIENEQPPPYDSRPNYSIPDSDRYYPSQPLMTATEIPVQTVVISTVPIRFGENPMQLQCPSCQARIFTRIAYRSGTLTWLVAGGFCIFGCWLGCPCIPFCIRALKDVEHRCPNCNIHLGTYYKI